MPKPKLPFKNFRWSTSLAYAVGLLVTDGNLSKDGRHLTMRSSDRELLVVFKNCLSLKTKIAKSNNDTLAKKPSYRVQFGNVQFFNWLVSIGVKPAKTYTIGAIKIPDKFFRDFLRGHLDGDGSIFTYKDRYNIYKGRIYTNRRIFTKFCSASKSHASWLFNKIIALSKIRGALLCKIPKDDHHVPMWEIKFAKKESIKLWRWIFYKSSLPCLKRKQSLAYKLARLVANDKRRQYTRIK